MAHIVVGYTDISEGGAYTRQGVIGWVTGCNVLLASFACQ